MQENDYLDVEFESVDSEEETEFIDFEEEEEIEIIDSEEEEIENIMEETNNSKEDDNFRLKCLGVAGGIVVAGVGVCLDFVLADKKGKCPYTIKLVKSLIDEKNS